MAKEILIAGTKTHNDYVPVELKDTVGKTVEAVVETWVPGAEGPDKCLRLLFSDGTRHGFVVGCDDSERPSNVEAGLESEECGELIPDPTAGDGPLDNKHHDESCSLFNPDHD